MMVRDAACWLVRELMMAAVSPMHVHVHVHVFSSTWLARYSIQHHHDAFASPTSARPLSCYSCSHSTALGRLLTSPSAFQGALRPFQCGLFQLVGRGTIHSSNAIVLSAAPLYLLSRSVVPFAALYRASRHAPLCFLPQEAVNQGSTVPSRSRVHFGLLRRTLATTPCRDKAHQPYAASAPHGNSLHCSVHTGCTYKTQSQRFCVSINLRSRLLPTMCNSRVLTVSCYAR